MDSERPKRHIKKPSRYSQSPSPIPLNPRKPAIPEVRRPQKRPLQAILVEPIPADLVAFPPSKQRSIPLYTPPLGYIEYKAGGSVCEALDELSTFLLLFSEACVDQIVAATRQAPLRFSTTMDSNDSLRSSTLYWLSILYGDT
jgi:hypothetical protein